MSYGNYTQGWDDFPDEDDGYGGQYDESGGSKIFPFLIPRPQDKANPFAPDPARKRVLFLSGRPVRVWIHPLYKVEGVGKLRETICLRKNEIDERGCPACMKKIKLQYVGYFTVIDMGFVQREAGSKNIELMPSYGKPDKDGNRREYQFQKRILGAKKGGKGKPGVLQTLQMEMVELGMSTLTGTVWDVRRDGGLTEAVGNVWKYQRTLKPDEWMRYLEHYGADPEKVDLEPVDFSVQLKAQSYEELASMFRIGQPQEHAQRGNGARTGGAKWDEQEGHYQQKLPVDNGGSDGPPSMSDVPPPEDEWY